MKKQNWWKIRKVRDLVFNLFNYKCYYCRKVAQCIDHIIPTSRGGSDNILNLAASCFECNFKKGKKTAHEFYLYLNII